MEAIEIINDTSKLVANSIRILKDCNVAWDDPDIVMVILLLEQALEKLTNKM